MNSPGPAGPAAAQDTSVTTNNPLTNAAHDDPTKTSPQASKKFFPRLKEFLSRQLLVIKWKELSRSKEPKDFWAGLQSIVLILAIMAGGIWTGITFGALGSVNKARAELESIELQNARNRNQKFDIELNLDVTQLKPPSNDQSQYISVLVTVKNIGTENIILCFEEPDNSRKTICPTKEDASAKADSTPKIDRKYIQPVTVTSVRHNDDSTGLIFGKPLHVDSWRDDDHSQHLKGLDIRVGQTESLTALVPLKDVGLYRIAFAVLQPDEKALVDPTLKSIWSISKFFVVKENSSLP